MYAREKGEDYAHYRKRLTEKYIEVFGEKPTYRYKEGRKQRVK